VDLVRNVLSSHGFIAGDIFGCNTNILMLTHSYISGADAFHARCQNCLITKSGIDTPMSWHLSVTGVLLNLCNRNSFGVIDREVKHVSKNGKTRGVNERLSLYGRNGKRRRTCGRVFVGTSVAMCVG
jgi:hypothetical protein